MQIISLKMYSQMDPSLFGITILINAFLKIDFFKLLLFKISNVFSKIC